MRLSLATGTFESYMEEGVELETALKAMRDCGFHCVDFEIKMDMLGDNLEECAHKVKEIFVSLGLTAPQGHAPMYNPLDPPEDLDCIDLYTRTLYFCKLVGIPYVVIHPGARPNNDRKEC